MKKEQVRGFMSRHGFLHYRGSGLDWGLLLAVGLGVCAALLAAVFFGVLVFSFVSSIIGSFHTILLMAIAVFGAYKAYRCARRFEAWLFEDDQ